MVLDKKFRFFLDGEELKNDPYNWEEVNLRLQRTLEKWGQVRFSSMETITLVKEDALRLQEIRNSGNSSQTTTFDIKIQDADSKKYYTFQETLLNYHLYKEIQEVGKGFRVEVGLIDNTCSSKLESREDNNLIIGNPLSIEGLPITNLPLIEAEFERKKLRFYTGWRWSKYLQKTPDEGASFQLPLANLWNPNSSGNDIQLSWGLEKLNSNDPSASNQSGNEYFGIAYTPGASEMLFQEDVIDRVVNLNGSFDFEMALAENGIASNQEYDLIYNLDEYQYDNNTNQYVKTGNIISTLFAMDILTTDSPATATTPFNGDMNIPFFNSAGNHVAQYFQNLTINTSFTKKKNRAYGFHWRLVDRGTLNKAVGVYIYAEIVDNGYNYLNSYYDDNLDEYPNTSHKGQMNYEKAQSLIEQCTDSPLKFRSELFGRTDLIDPKTGLNYAQDGLGSLYFLTDGFLLRDGVNSDNTDHNFTGNFRDWYLSMDALFGIGMYYDGEFISIEKRIDTFGNNEIEINPSSICKYEYNDLKYTQIKVGNEKVNNETINGTNEHNTINFFTVPLWNAGNTLNLVTVYKTSYTDIEETRRLSFLSSDNVDSKNDNLTFMSKVKRKVGGGWITVIGLDGYDSVTGVILPEYAGNLDLSPKRMLYNNIDLISACFYQSTSNLKIERTENLATLVSQKTGGPLLTEIADLTNAEMTDQFFNPVLFDLEIEEKDLMEILGNPFNCYTFEYGCNNDIVKGYLWNATITGTTASVQLLEKSI